RPRPRARPHLRAAGPQRLGQDDADPPPVRPRASDRRRGPHPRHEDAVARGLAAIGYMPQAEAIYPELSVGENLGFFARLEGRADPAAIDRVLELVELRDRKGTPALQLSGGMRRRLSLACTLVHEPKVLFLDEPTVGVDPALRVQFWTHFRRLASEGTTILVASHVMDEADRCDELLFVRNGKVIGRGT